MAQGILFLFSGPSGVGKKSLLDLIINRPDLNLKYSISMTTRAKRTGEVEGIDYFFVQEAEFLAEVARGNMLEHAYFFNAYYGTPKSYVYAMLQQGKNVILEIETIGAEQVMAQMPECVSIFILPPSLEELGNRLLSRNTETAEKIKLRLAKAEKEITLQDKYDHVVCNDNLERAANEIVSIILKHIA